MSELEKPGDDTATAGAEAAVESSVSEETTAPAEAAEVAEPMVEGDGAEAAAPAEPAPRDDLEWYVLRVQAGRENTVQKHLNRRIKTDGYEDRITQVLVPSEMVTEMKAGKKRVEKKKIFPGYVMVEMVLDDEVLYFVKGTPGVGDFIGSGGRPDPLPDHEVEKMLGMSEQAKNEEPKLKINFQKGQSVKIKQGAFEDFNGVVEDINEGKGTISVIVTIFGRATPLELEYWEVEPL